MKLTKDEFKGISVFGSQTRPVQPITREQLKNAGVAFAAYGIGVGDVVEFPENAFEHLLQQPTVVGGQNMQVLVGVKRGKVGDAELKPGLFAMGSLIRQDGNRRYTCDFTEEMGTKYDNHEARLAVLCGKTIKGTEPLSIEVVKFDRATRRPVLDPNGNNVLIPGTATKIEYA